MESVLLLVGLIAFWYFVTPLAVWRRLRANAAASRPMELFDPTRHSTTPQITAFLQENVAALTGGEEQFTQVADLVRREGTTTTRLVLLQHPDGEIASVMVVSSEAGSSTAAVEFTAHFVNGTVLDVSNVSTVRIFAPTPDHLVYRFPNVNDPARLHRLFRGTLRSQLPSAVIRRLDLSDPARFYTTATDAEYVRQVATGYYRLDERNGVYMPTLKGAYLMSWKLMFPFKHIRSAILHDRAARLSKEIETSGRSDSFARR